MPVLMKKRRGKLNFNSVTRNRRFTGILDEEVHLIFSSLFGFMIELGLQNNSESRFRTFPLNGSHLDSRFVIVRNDSRHALVIQTLEPSCGSLSIVHRFRFEEFIIGRRKFWVCRAKSR